MAVAYYQRNEVEFERTTHSVTVPNNDAARQMYYLNRVCTAIDCNNDNDIQRFANIKIGLVCRLKSNICSLLYIES